MNRSDSDLEGPYGIVQVESSKAYYDFLYKVTYNGEILRGDQAKHMSLASSQARLLNEAFWRGAGYQYKWSDFIDRRTAEILDLLSGKTLA